MMPWAAAGVAPCTIERMATNAPRMLENATPLLPCGSLRCRCPVAALRQQNERADCSVRAEDDGGECVMRRAIDRRGVDRRRAIADRAHLIEKCRGAHARHALELRRMH